jgi:hypothetical protein
VEDTVTAALSTRRLPEIAAGLYTLWGLLHVGLGAGMSWAMLAPGTPSGELEAESAMFFLSAMVFGGQAIVVALTLNRFNDRLGYWLNLTVLGVIDAAFLVLMVLPGYVGVIGGLSGPVLWAAAALISTIALRTAPRRAGWERSATPPASRMSPASSAASASCGTRPAGW